MLSEDGNIGGELTINAVRTDDVLRIYFNITYTFLKDVSFKRLALFQYDSDRYQANFFRRFACGDGDKILLDTAFVTDDGIENGYNSHYERFADAGKEPWFYFYDTPQRATPVTKNFRTDTKRSVTIKTPLSLLCSENTTP